MYFPYFRGKQYELIAIRERADLLAASNFTPIIEPVKESLNGLVKALSSVCEANGQAILVVNPQFGHHLKKDGSLDAIFDEHFVDTQAIQAGILLTEETSARDVLRLVEHHKNRKIVLIHNGFSEARSLAEDLPVNTIFSNIFIENKCGKLYQKHFKSDIRVLIRDGFEKRTNSKHPPIEPFSDLHVTYDLEGMTGFGDFLIAGDDYSESGGPAYSIAIHITFIDKEKDDAMFIHHFKSIRKDDTTDPAGKFSEALDKLVDEVRGGNSKIYQTDAIAEFLQLHDRGHFPGLGYVKKLSMQHHLETFAIFLQNAEKK